MTRIEKYIKKKGGILSGELADYLVRTHGISEVTARQRIHRLKSPIHKLTGLFADNQSFIYHAENYQNVKYFEDLIQSFEIHAKRCFTIVNAIDYHHGIIPKDELANYSMSPINKVKGHMQFSSLIEKLRNYNIIIEHDGENYGLNLFASKTGEPNLRHFKAIQFTKTLVIQQFEIWSKNIGLTSFKKGKSNNVVGGFQFAFTSPTYIDGLSQYINKTKKPGCLVADILIGNETNEETITFFLSKISAIKASNPSLRIFPVLLLDGISVKGLNKLKSAGVLIASIKEIYGRDYSDLLKNLINTVTNAGAILKTNPEKYIELMSKLTKLIDGKTNNLRGDLFELAVGYYYSKFCQSLDIGKRVPVDDGYRTREIDVLAIYENEIRIIECKGYNYPIEDDYMEEYLAEKVSDIRKWLKKTHPEKRHQFEIWSTGGFTDEASDRFLTIKERTRKYDLNYYNAQDILEKAGELKSGKFKEILKDYYLKEIV